MPVPIVDAAQALKANLEKTEDALLKVLFLFLKLKQANYGLRKVAAV